MTVKYFLIGAATFLTFLLVLAFIFPFRHSSNHSGYGACHRCHRTWDIVNGHDTPYKSAGDGDYASRSCFPLCQKCWADLRAPQARLPYYRQMFDEWRAEYPPLPESEWESIRASVLAGN